MRFEADWEGWELEFHIPWSTLGTSGFSDGSIINANFALSDADGGKREGNLEMSTPPAGPGNFKNPTYWPVFILRNKGAECPVDVWAEETVENGIALAVVNAVSLNPSSKDQMPRVTVLYPENKRSQLSLHNSFFGTYLWGRHTILPSADDSILTLTVHSRVASRRERIDTLILQLPRHRRSRAVRSRYPIEKLESLPEPAKNIGSLIRDCALEVALNPKMATLLKQPSVDSVLRTFTHTLERLLTAETNELNHEWRFSHIQAFRSPVSRNCVPYKVYVPSEIDTTKRYPVYFRLKAGYVDGGLLVTSDEGTPQGSILSPMLSNIFLHYVLDTWYETIVKSHVRGYCELVRYADDFICLVRYADDAERIERGLHNRFNKYGLALHPAKTRRISFGHFERENAQRQSRRANTFDFLGFTHYCDTSRKGKFKVGRMTSRKKFSVKCKAMNRWLKDIRNAVPAKDWWKTLQAKLRGHYQYYGVSENYTGIHHSHGA